MKWWEELEKTREHILRVVTQKFAIQFGWTKVGSTSAMGDKDQVQTADGQKGQRPARRLEQWGLRTRAPSKGVRTFWIRIGSSNVIYLGIAPTKGYGPGNLDEGEVALYCMADGTIVRLTKAGKVAINSASGQDTVVNDGTLKVARDTDPTASGTIACAVVGPVTGVSTATFTYTPPGGSPQTLATLSFTGSGTGGTANITGRITNGAPRFKA